MEIVSYPHPALFWKSKPVSGIDAKLRKIIREMSALMYDAKGIGLAANQVGLPYRLFVVNVTGDSEQQDEEHVFINPEIVNRKGSIDGEEGCLSLPEVYGQVRRAEEIVVAAYDLTGHAFEATLTEMPGRVVQHETDHLNGVLFPDRMTESARKEIEPRLSDFEAHFRRKQVAGEIPSDEVLKKQLRDLEPS